ncbi:AmmeMemoRadiSam system protein B [Candidatus Woesearchaeota archaeon]|nr:AmmeMemoRadiSam system protein B [Candidatus Woesearchaeota archaeon]
MIHPALSGKFYEDDFNKLNKQIEDCFTKAAGDLPAKRRNVKLKGILVPHSSYLLAGKCYAWAYKELAEAQIPSRIIILVPDNKGIYTSPVTSREPWMTPFGALKVDAEFIQDLQERYPALQIEENCNEYAIEVQLPFMQYAYRDHLTELKFAPVIIPPTEDFIKLAEAIASIDDNALIIAAANLTRYGIDHGSLPFKWSVKESIYAQDQQAIEFILDMDAIGFIQHCKKTRMNMVGVFAVATALEAMKLLFAKKGRLLDYYTSADITKDYGSAIGFSSIIFE